MRRWTAPHAPALINAVRRIPHRFRLPDDGSFSNLAIAQCRKEKKNENAQVSYRPSLQIRFCVNRFHVFRMDWLGWDSPNRAEVFPRHRLALVGRRVATYIRRAVLPLHDNRRRALSRRLEGYGRLRPFHGHR
jgi:hypothetical protein